MDDDRREPGLLGEREALHGQARASPDLPARRLAGEDQRAREGLQARPRCGRRAAGFVGTDRPCAGRARVAVEVERDAADRDAAADALRRRLEVDVIWRDGGDKERIGVEAIRLPARWAAGTEPAIIGAIRGVGG